MIGNDGMMGKSGTPPRVATNVLIGRAAIRATKKCVVSYRSCSPQAGLVDLLRCEKLSQRIGLAFVV